MSRRWVPALALLAATVVAAGAGASVGEHDAAAQVGGGDPPRPNVVVVMTDDQDRRSVEVMQTVQEKLAGQGTTFSNFFATFPLCCPSRATLLTGQYAHNHGVRSNVAPNGGYTGYDERGGLPIALSKAGYRTGWVGKYLTGYGSGDSNPREVPRGWTKWYAPVGGAGGMYDYTLNQNGRLRSYGSDREDYQTDVYARKATNFIASSARGSEPFFLVVAPLAPHGDPRREQRPNPEPAPRHLGSFDDAPLPRPPSFNEADVWDKPAFVQERPRLSRRDKRALTHRYRDRLASLLAVDDAVRDMLRKLRATGELGNTLFVFTSDNGYLLGEHRLQAKTVLYEESVRVPLLMRGPGIPEGATRSQVAGNIDLAPTILDAAGVSPLRTPDGISLLPLAADPTVEAGRDVLLENLTSPESGIPSYTAVRTPEYMYAEYPNGDTELYDLTRDPFQLESEHVGGPYEQPGSARLEARLSQRLNELEDCAGSACR